MMGAFLCGCFRKCWYPQIIHFNRRFSMIFTIHFGGIPPLFLDFHPMVSSHVDLTPGPPWCCHDDLCFPFRRAIDICWPCGRNWIGCVKEKRWIIHLYSTLTPWSGRKNHRWLVGLGWSWSWSWVGWLVGWLGGWVVGFVEDVEGVFFVGFFFGGCLNRTERMSGLAEGKS